MAGVSAQTLRFNGIDGATGEYLLPPMDRGRLAALLRRGGPPGPVGLARGLKAGLDPGRLADAGWGVIFADGVRPEIREALEPLLRRRRAQAMQDDRPHYHELVRLPGERKLKFLARHGAGPGPVDPRRVPYYLLIVGDPETIPFDFQHQLDVQYAVGRIAFDEPEDYARYTDGVVAGERTPVAAPRLALLGVQNPADEPTRITVEHLVRPLEQSLARQRPGWRIGTLLRDAAGKAELSRLLGGGETPAVLFTAGHAVGFRAGTGRQQSHQGALLCSDWPGPGGGPMLDDYFFAAADVPERARLPGLVSFHFACYSAGTPRLDSFAEQAPREIAPRAFVARLPQRLLRAGALAFVGHIDRAWEQSFLWQEAGSQIAVFESALLELTAGRPVGLAMASFGQRYAEIATELSVAAGHRPAAGQGTDEVSELALWTAFHDARSYVVIGDPAVRLNV